MAQWFLRSKIKCLFSGATTVFRTLVPVVREGPFPLPEGGFPPSGTFRRRLVPEVYVGNSNASGLNLSIRRINVRSREYWFSFLLSPV
eukprot:scaffold26146_cov62-Attheya_sp.AAC.1